MVNNQLREKIKWEIRSMPELKNYRLFISHSWSYGDAYDKLVVMFKECPCFKWTDYSVPRNDPIHNAPTTTALRNAIYRQMAPVNCVIVMGGVYSTYSKWINIEIEMAQRMGKPIVMVAPWGAERTSEVVKSAADVIVGWRSSSIVEAIRSYAI